MEPPLIHEDDPLDRDSDELWLRHLTATCVFGCVAIIAMT